VSDDKHARDEAQLAELTSWVVEMRRRRVDSENKEAPQNSNVEMWIAENRRYAKAQERKFLAALLIWVCAVFIPAMLIWWFVLAKHWRHEDFLEWYITLLFLCAVWMVPVIERKLRSIFSQ
jgi:cytoskeletal protein RodZ